MLQGSHPTLQMFREEPKIKAVCSAEQRDVDVEANGSDEKIHPMI